MPLAFMPLAFMPLAFMPLAFIPGADPFESEAEPRRRRVPAEARASPFSQRKRAGSRSGQKPVDRRGKVVVAPERRPEFAVDQRVAGAADRQPERRRA